MQIERLNLKLEHVSPTLITHTLVSLHGHRPRSRTTMNSCLRLGLNQCLGPVSDLRFSPIASAFSLIAS